MCAHSLVCVRTVFGESGLPQRPCAARAALIPSIRPSIPTPTPPPPQPQSPPTAEEAGEGWDGLRAGCDTFLQAATDATFRQVALIDAPAVLGWQTWKRLDDRTTSRTLREGLEQLRRAGQLRGDDVEAVAAALSGAMNELALWVAAQPKPRLALARARSVVASMLDVWRP